MRLPRGLPKLRSLGEINQPSTLAYIKNGNFPAFTAKYSHYYTFPITAPTKLGQDYHPCYIPLKEHFMTRSDPLWSFLVLSKQVSGTKGVVRRWLQRRTRAAFTEALKEAGYKKDGSRMPNTPPLKPELKGTLCFIIQPGVVDTDHKTLVSHTREVIQTLIEFAGQPAKGNKKSHEGREQKGPQRWTRQNNNKPKGKAGQIQTKRNFNKPAAHQSARGNSDRQNTYQTRNERPGWRKTPA